MTKTARTEQILTAVLEEHGAPTHWTEAEAVAVWNVCPVKALFDGFEDFMCALIVRARQPY